MLLRKFKNTIAENHLHDVFFFFINDKLKIGNNASMLKWWNMDKGLHSQLEPWVWTLLKSLLEIYYFKLYLTQIHLSRKMWKGKISYFSLTTVNWVLFVRI